MSEKQRYPKIHNAAWPGVVGKEPGTDHPPIDLDSMIAFTAKARVNGKSFDGIDLFLSEPHIPIDSSEDDIKRIAGKIGKSNLAVGTLIAPVGAPVGGSAKGSSDEIKRFLNAVKKSCQIGQWFNKTGIRTYGSIRIDSSTPVGNWLKNPERSQKKIAETFNEAADIASDWGEVLVAEGEICWGGMHSWTAMLDLLERVDRPDVLGFQADMAHTLLYLLGYNANPEDAILPKDYDWNDIKVLDDALVKLTDKLRPWTYDLHVAQNDATVFGSGAHDKTGRHCLPTDPNGKLEIAHHAGYWLRDGKGALTKRMRHLCWDGCMFPNDVMMKEDTWNTILASLVSVQDVHGWDE